jgi:hypothetical protein
MSNYTEQQQRALDYIREDLGITLYEYQERLLVMSMQRDHTHPLLHLPAKRKFGIAVDGDGVRSLTRN